MRPISCSNHHLLALRFPFWFCLVSVLLIANHHLQKVPVAAALSTQRAIATTNVAASRNNNISKTQKMPSFYQRPLPSTCIAFSSPLGRRVFTSAMQNRGLKSFFCLVEQHSTQSEPAYCGLATLVVALNAMAIDPRRHWKTNTPWRWYTEELLPCCRDFKLENVKKQGMTMADFRCLAICQGLHVNMHYADDEHTTLEGFRESIRQVCVENYNDAQPQPPPPQQLDMTTSTSSQILDHKGRALPQVLVVSYDRKSMGQTGSGHFSPIAAYDDASDSVLILDTARFKYGSHWVKVPLLFDALYPIDADSGRSRGYILLTNERQESTESQSRDEVPQTLLRPLETTVAVKLKEDFHAFLETKTESSELSWDEFRTFWTCNDTDSGQVWYVCEPVIKPCQDDDVALMENVLVQLRNHMRNHVDKSIPESSSEDCRHHNPCRPNLRRSVPLMHTEAIYLIYLACLEHKFGRPVDFGDATGSDILRASIETLQDAIF